MTIKFSSFHNYTMLTIDQINSNTVIELSSDLIGLRLDTALAIIIPDISRNRLQSWIKNQILTINGQFVSTNYRVKGGETIHFINTDRLNLANISNINTNDIKIEELTQFAVADIPIKIVYQDEDILVIDKPVGLVVHPGASNHDDTLMNGLLFHYKELYNVPRAGIVHRIDKDTSGLLVVARTLSAHFNLVQQLSNHTMKRTYNTIVYGVAPSSGIIDANIIRDKSNRTRMMVTKLSGKSAITKYKVLEYLPHSSLLECQLETGRTHQIRVHMQHLGYPILGDAVYGKGMLQVLQNKLKIDKNDNESPLMLHRQALHAARLKLIHPKSGQEMEFTSELPADFASLLEYLRELKCEL